VVVARILGFTHVKLPVANLERSVRWYAALLDMRLTMEFVEEGELRGAELVEPVSGVRIALRDRAFCAGRPVLAGFDLFALEVDAVETLYRLAERCDGLGVTHSGVREFSGGAALDVPDPDGTVVRLHLAQGRPPFVGVEIVPDGFRTYERPRLDGVTLNTDS
jgi:catechol 2,3-dioxygenase-like lactoylglutathione lyase family enzyme